VSHGFAAWIGSRKEIAWWRPAFAGSTDWLSALTTFRAGKLTSGSNRIPALKKSAFDFPRDPPKLTRWNLHCARQSAPTHRTTKCTHLDQAIVSRSMPCKSTFSSNQWQCKHTERKQVQPIHHRTRAASSLS
jgi:hypothetical protein